MNTHEQRLIEEYASAGNAALLLARLERKYHAMKSEMREQAYLMPPNRRPHESLSAVKLPIVFDTASKV